MERVAVHSSNVKSVGYDAETQTLEVEFRTGAHEEPRIYRYAPVESGMYDAIVDPEMSAGKLVAQVRHDPAISCERIESTTPSSPAVDGALASVPLNEGSPV